MTHTTAVKGFTLIELLIVIAIVAVLSVVVILTLNPAELLRQARDSNRISDMSTLKSALSLYLSDVTSPSIGTSTTCYASAASGTAPTLCGSRYSGTIVTMVATASQAVNGTGWIPVNLTAISSGAPIGNLPVDPVNNATYFYSYAVATSTTVFELGADMESTRYSSGGSNVENNDGGNTATLFEVGTAPGLSL